MSLPNISNIGKKSKVAGILRWYVPNWNDDAVEDPKPEGPGKEPKKQKIPYIDFRPATSENKAWIAERLKWEKSSEGQRLTRGKATVGAIDAIREAEYPMFAKTVVAGWGDFEDDDGKEFKFAQGDLARTESLLRALGIHNFDDFRDTARQPKNASAAEGRDELAGNS